MSIYVYDVLSFLEVYMKVPPPPPTPPTLLTNYSEIIIIFLIYDLFVILYSVQYSIVASKLFLNLKKLFISFQDAVI